MDTRTIMRMTNEVQADWYGEDPAPTSAGIPGNFEVKDRKMMMFHNRAG